MYLPAEESVNLMITRNVATGLATGSALRHASPLRFKEGNKRKDLERCAASRSRCSRGSVSRERSPRGRYGPPPARPRWGITRYPVELLFEQRDVIPDRLVYLNGVKPVSRTFAVSALSRVLPVSYLAEAPRGAPLPAILPARQALYRHRAGAAIKMEL
jgi:hypothetical protein